MSVYNVCGMGDYGGHLYKIIEYPSGQRTWDQAKAHAESMPDIGCGPPHLVTITSRGESNFITNLLKNSNSCGGLKDAWIGIIGAGDAPGEFDWVAPDTGNNSFENWCVGQPSQNGEPVGEIWIDEAGCSNTDEENCNNPFGCWNDNEKDLVGGGGDNDKYILEYECMEGGNGEGDPHFQTVGRTLFCYTQPVVCVTHDAFDGTVDVKFLF